MADWMMGGGLGGDMSGDVGRGGGNIRFWMPKGQERKVIFLTEGDEAFGPIWEHQCRLDGRWTNWFSCVAPLGVECPLCAYANDNDGMFRRYKGVFFTIIDTHEFEDRSGTKRSNVKRLMCCKKDTVEKLKRKYLQRVEADQGLRGAMFNIYRGNSDKAASVGDDFDFVKMVDLETLPDTEPFDLLEMLKPDAAKCEAAAKKLAGEVAAEGTKTAVDYGS